MKHVSCQEDLSHSEIEELTGVNLHCSFKINGANVILASSASSPQAQQRILLKLECQVCYRFTSSCL